MPFVSEHPRSIDVIHRLSDECDTEIEAFIKQYIETRSLHRRTPKPASPLLRRLEDGDTSALRIDDLTRLVETREATAARKREDLQLVEHEINLLRRELRRAWRENPYGVLPETRQPQRVRTPAAGAYGIGGVQEYLRRARERQSWSWLRPWLRGFLPSSA